MYVRLAPVPLSVPCAGPPTIVYVSASPSGSVAESATVAAEFSSVEMLPALALGAWFTRRTVTATVAKDRKGGKSTLDVTGGRFVATQDRTLLTTLTLTGGDFGVCGKRLLAQSPPPKKKSIRHLWGDGKGRFRTKGRYSAATVRGTHWLTDDRCDGTLIRVKRGAVTVRDLVRAKSLALRAPRKYLAKAGKVRG